MLTNIYNVPVYEDNIYPYGEYHSNNNRDKAIALLCEYLGIEIYKTNATQSGHEEILLKEADFLK